MTETIGIQLVSYSGAMGLILLGIFALVNYEHLIRVIFGLILLEAGVNLFLITLAYRADAVAPIMIEGQTAAMVDPIPHALVLTAIVIGVAVQALALALVIKTYQKYGTLNTRILAQRIAEESGTRMIEGIPTEVKKV
ncbi:MAG: cation:proton antiporter subunit C [Thiomargarita sp.]|nr:cation:proton antiporter subunit C [Thiomargarita sp.]